MLFRVGRFGVFVSLLLLSLACSKEVDVMAVRLSETSVTLMVGETATLVATVEPSVADYDGISWTSSDPSVATVTDGVIQVHKAGSAIITASAGGVISRACTITVGMPVIEVNEPEEPVAETSGTVESGEPDTVSEEPEEVDTAEVEVEEATEDAEPEPVEVQIEEPEESVETTESSKEEPVVLGKCFVYDVDFGEEGSFIDIDSLITVTDWRDRDFNDYTNYWGYYGPFEFKFDLANAQCDLNGTRQDLPQSITLIQTDPGAVSVKDPSSGSLINVPGNRHGCLMCKFSTVGITQAFNIYVKAKVKYGFGTIETDWITIPVVMEPPK